MSASALDGLSTPGELSTAGAAAAAPLVMTAMPWAELAVAAYRRFSPDAAHVLRSPTFHNNGSTAAADQLSETMQDVATSLGIVVCLVYVAGVSFYLASSSTALRGVVDLFRVAWVMGPSLATHITRETPNPAAAVEGGVKDVVLRGAHGVSHLAIIMDGNRRYGKKLVAQSQASPSDATGVVPATSPLNGHKLGGDKLMEVIDWSIARNIKMLTVYAFSTENWNRSQQEIDVLMALFEFFFQRIRTSAKEKGIFIRFVATDPERLPRHVYELMVDVEQETKQHANRRIVVNVCVSYGARSEIVNACRSFVKTGGDRLTPADVTEKSFAAALMRSITEAADDNSEGASGLSETEVELLTEPQLLLRTSGEQRLSNFLLYQCAYSELVFVPHTWPELNARDFDNVLGEFVSRQRRFGK